MDYGHRLVAVFFSTAPVRSRDVTHDFRSSAAATPARLRCQPR